MTAPTPHVKRLAQTLFDSAVERVGGGTAWRRLTEACKAEQISVSVLDVIVGRYDREDNPRPVIEDVLAASAYTLKLKLLARHG
jgi:hypothetical protein